jgi:preprotein translocase subunit SecG
MYNLLLAVHVLVSLLLIAIVLFQADESSGLAGAFGTMSGPSGGAMFGKKGAAGVVTRFTALLVAVFLLTSFFLTLLVSKDFVDREEFVQRAPISSSGAPVQSPIPGQ